MGSAERYPSSRLVRDVEVILVDRAGHCEVGHGGKKPRMFAFHAQGDRAHEVGG